MLWSRKCCSSHEKIAIIADTSAYLLLLVQIFVYDCKDFFTNSKNCMLSHRVTALANLLVRGMNTYPEVHLYLFVFLLFVFCIHFPPCLFLASLCRVNHMSHRVFSFFVIFAFCLVDMLLLFRAIPTH